MSSTQRIRLHARIAEALEDVYAGSVDSHAAELASHYAEAESLLGSEKLFKYTLMAGRAALSAYAYEEAESYFRQALEVKGPGPVDEERADI